MYTEEVWKDINAHYQVSNFARVRSNLSGEWVVLSTYKMNKGYLAVTLSINGKKKPHLVHRLVAEAFIPNPENKPQVNHKNGIRTDDCVSNLEWVSNEENQRHSWKYLGRKNPHEGKFGSDSTFYKVVLQIKDGKIIGRFNGAREAMRATGVNYKYISSCCHGKIKQTGGFSWVFEKDLK